MLTWHTCILTLGGYAPAQSLNPKRPTMPPQDEGDLAARTLPMLSGPAPLDAWAVVLGKEEAVENPRWTHGLGV